MQNYVITTDTTADLPKDYLEKESVGLLSLVYMLEGETYDKDCELDPHIFYEKMRSGSMPTTSQVNPENAGEIFEGYLKQGLDILHIAFSSGLSGSFQSAKIAAQMLKEEYPDRKILVVDSLSASMGEGLLVYKVAELKKAGKTLEEAAAWAEENKLHIGHNFTVDDLFHLYRGGRVSKATAILGSAVGIKPILHVDNEGHLTSIGKTRGRKKSLTALVDRMEAQIAGFDNDMVMISHGDCEEDAEFVAELVRKRLGIKNIMINYVGPTIGAHSGPGTLALFFMGNER